MSLIVPIFFMALFMGLYSKRITIGHWVAMILWITVVVIYHLIHHA